jgi:hypothetical protein
MELWYFIKINGEVEGVFLAEDALFFFRVIGF